MSTLSHELKIDLSDTIGELYDNLTKALEHAPPAAKIHIPNSQVYIMLTWEKTPLELAVEASGLSEISLWNELNKKYYKEADKPIEPEQNTKLATNWTIELLTKLRSRDMSAIELHSSEENYAMEQLVKNELVKNVGLMYMITPTGGLKLKEYEQKGEKHDTVTAEEIARLHSINKDMPDGYEVKSEFIKELLTSLEFKDMVYFAENRAFLTMKGYAAIGQIRRT